MIHRWLSITLLAATISMGGGGLLAFAVFVYNGPPAWIGFGWGRAAVLYWDAALSLLFFIQHSSMLRRPVRRFMRRFIPDACLDAVYSIASGGLLLAVVVLWQPTPQAVVVLSGWGYLFARACFYLSVLGFMWTAKSFGHFDPLGAGPLLARLGKAEPAPRPLVVSGSYGWVRHPFYFFSIVMIWSFPAPTHDRLLFNLSWTVWIWLGALLEERDLVRIHGEAYRAYQQTVPMLLPLRRRKRK